MCWRSQGSAGTISRDGGTGEHHLCILLLLCQPGANRSHLWHFLSALLALLTPPQISLWPCFHLVLLHHCTQLDTVALGQAEPDLALLYCGTHCTRLIRGSPKSGAPPQWILWMEGVPAPQRTPLACLVLVTRGACIFKPHKTVGGETVLVRLPPARYCTNRLKHMPRLVRLGQAKWGNKDKNID